MLQNATQDATHDKQEIDFINGLQDLTLKQNQNTPNMTDMSVPPLDAPEMNHEVEEAKVDDTAMAYNVTDQEARLQHEEKYGVYMSTFGYEGDNSNLDSTTDTDSNMTAFPFLD